MTTIERGLSAPDIESSTAARGAIIRQTPFGTLTLNTNLNRTTSPFKPEVLIQLTPTEAKVLEHMLLGNTVESTPTSRQHMVGLRKKLGQNPEGPQMIRTKRGFGFFIETTDTEKREEGSIKFTTPTGVNLAYLPNSGLLFSSEAQDLEKPIDLTYTEGGIFYAFMSNPDKIVGLTYFGGELTAASFKVHTAALRGKIAREAFSQSSQVQDKTILYKIKGKAFSLSPDATLAAKAPEQSMPSRHNSVSIERTEVTSMLEAIAEDDLLGKLIAGGNISYDELLIIFKLFKRGHKVPENLADKLSIALVKL